jgi:hypothetical protein
MVTTFRLGDLPLKGLLNMSDPIQDAINAAKNAAPATGTPATATATATAAPAGNVTPFVPGKAVVLSAGEMMQGSFSVDTFFKVSEDGIKIGDKPGLITDTIDVAINLAEAFYYFGVKYGDKPVNYEKTTNHISSMTGKPWNSVLEMAARVDGTKYKGEYRSGDIPVVLLTDVKDIKGVVVGEAGTRVGKSLSTTEWKEWEQFLRTVTKAGLNVDSSVVRVTIGSKERKNNAGNKWGVLTFALVGELASDEAENQAA